MIQKLITLFKVIWPILLIAVVILAAYFFYSAKVVQQNEQLKQELLLKTALTDSLKTNQNKLGELNATKLTLQGTIKQLAAVNSDLNSSQKELIDRVKTADKINTVISAALISSTVLIDSLRSIKSVIDTTKHSVTFSDSTKNLTYKLIIDNVKAVNDSLPKLTIKQLKMINSQFVSFQWLPGKNNPISFSVSNSNQYFKTNDINSYVIPELIKVNVKPSFWQKVGKTVGTIGGTAIVFSVGVGVGVVLISVL